MNLRILKREDVKRAPPDVVGMLIEEHNSLVIGLQRAKYTDYEKRVFQAGIQLIRNVLGVK